MSAALSFVVGISIFGLVLCLVGLAVGLLSPFVCMGYLACLMFTIIAAILQGELNV